MLVSAYFPETQWFPEDFRSYTLQVLPKVLLLRNGVSIASFCVGSIKYGLQCKAFEQTQDILVLIVTIRCICRQFNCYMYCCNLTVSVICHFVVVPMVGLWSVSVVYLGHTHLFFHSSSRFFHNIPDYFEVRTAVVSTESLHVERLSAHRYTCTCTCTCSFDIFVSYVGLLEIMVSNKKQNTLYRLGRREGRESFCTIIMMGLKWYFHCVTLE